MRLGPKALALFLVACGARTGDLGDFASPDARNDSRVDASPADASRDAKPDAPSCALGLITLAKGLNSSESCFGSPNPVVVPIAVDATSVYWGAENSVSKVPKCGGKPKRLAAGDYQGVTSIAVDSAQVYWATCAKGIWSVSVDGGAATQLSTLDSQAVAVYANDLYFTSGSGLNRVPLGGGLTMPLTGASVPTQGLAVNASGVYWSYFYGTTISRVDLGGGASTTIASRQGGPTSLALDATTLYWTNTYGDEVVKIALAGGTPVTLASRQGGPQAIAVDDSNVYWTNPDTGTVAKVPIGGGTTTTLASHQTNPSAIAVDATSVYWSNSGSGYIPNDGSIMRLTPK